MGGIIITLHHLTLAQHLLALVFQLTYGSALGAMFGPIGRLRALLLALLAAIGFASLTRPWEHGVLLVLCAIGAVGLFIAAAWALSALGAQSHRPAALLSTAPVVDTPAPVQALPPQRSTASVAVRAVQTVKRRRRPRTV